MTVTLPQSTTDWVFYIINIATFLFCGISAIFRQDFDGASNELVTAMLYEWDRNGKIPKKKRKLVKPFRIARKVALAGLLIAIVLIIRKPLWILSILEVGLIIQTIVILINCLTQPDHNFSKYEQYWIVLVAVFLVMQRFPLGLFSIDIVIWQSQLPEGLSVAVQSMLWLIQIFMLFTSMLLAFNGFCKQKKRIKRIDYAKLSWNISDWYVKWVDKSKLLKCLLPLIVIVDLIVYLLKKAISFLVAMFNELLPSINDAIQRQVDTLDTQLIRLAFRGAIVCSLSMMYSYMELKGIHAESTRNIFSYVATVIVIPIVIEGIQGLRDRIKSQVRTVERKDSMEDILKETVQMDMERESKKGKNI